MIQLKQAMKAIATPPGQEEVERHSLLKRQGHTAQMSLEDTIAKIGRDSQLLAAFAFELRK